MSPRTIGLSDSICRYLIQTGVREPDALRAVREATSRLPGAHMQIAPEQGQFMALLVRLTNSSRCLEIGTYTGYSALSVALALPPFGRVLTCEIDAGYGAIAQRNWEGAGMADKVELRIGPALDTLNALLADRQAGHFDMAFIDADKENILAYYESCLTLIRTGGFLLIDNTLWSGAVADPSNHDPVTETLRTLNGKIHADPRVEMVLIPIGDGLTLARKIS